MDFISVIPTTYELVITGAAILVCTVTDIHSWKISPWVCLALVIAAAFEPGKDYVMSVIGTFIGFAPLFIVARFGKGGDGDSLLNGAIGFTLPLMYMLYMFLVTSVLYAVVLAGVVIRTRNMEKQLPFVPFLMAGWIVMLVLFLTGVLA